MSTLTILTFQPQINWPYGGSAATLRIKYSANFTDSLGRPVLRGLFQDVPCTITASVLTVPAFALITTNDARINPLVTCSAQFIDSNNTPRDWLFQQFSIPQVLAPSCGWDDLASYNQGSALVLPPEFYLNRGETTALVLSLIANLGIGPATNLALGTVLLSIAAADPALPKVWGHNDPLVRDALKLMGITLDALVATPADGNVLGFSAASNTYKPQATATPSLHASSHQNGGTDEISVADLSGLLADPQTPLAHASSHQNGGADEISVEGLSGLLADPQTPLLADNSITNAKLADVATATFKGRTTGGTGDPEDLTAAQATALLDVMVGDAGAGGTKGLVPAPAAGDAAAGKFLKSDGTYAAPSGTGAPADATYITQTANGGLSAEQALASLSTGLMRVETATGVITSITDSAGLAANISDETGSGALVFSTSPTITTPLISLTAAHASDDTYGGMQITGLNAGATIAQWEAVYLDSSSIWQLADANGTNTYPARGLAVAAYVNTDPATILTYGTVRNDAWNWTPGGPIYLSATPGGLTQTAPSTSGDKVQVVGYALTADIAFFDFNSTYLTVT